MKSKGYMVYLISALFIVCLTNLTQAVEQTENPSYKLDQDILYRSESAAQEDAYIQERCRLDVYYPAEQANFATVVWFHGGGLTGGERDVPEKLKNQGLAVVAVSYRLSPKVSCPVYIDDAAAAVAWVFKHIAGYGGDPDLIFVSGHSAGGYLTNMIGLDKRWLAKYNVDASRIAGLFPLSGHTITHFTVRKERGIPDTQVIVDAFAPLYHVRADAPPLILTTGDRDLELLGRYEENAYLWRMMKVAKHPETLLYEIQGFDHGGMVAPACDITVRYIQERLKSLNKQ